MKTWVVTLRLKGCLEGGHKKKGAKDGVGAESDQHVNICSFVVYCDRVWPSTQ